MRQFMLKQTRQSDFALFSRLGKLDASITAETAPLIDVYGQRSLLVQVDGVGEVKRALGHLAEAAQSLLLADDTARAARQMPTDESAAAGSDIVGADALLKLLSRPSSLGAPVEAGEAVRAVLAALSAVDALHDALTADDDDA